MYLVDDNQILELFFARSEQAIKELDSKYGKKVKITKSREIYYQL